MTDVDPHGDDGVDVEVETASMLYRFLPRNRFFFEIFGIVKTEQSLREYFQSQINNKIKYSRLNMYIFQEYFVLILIFSKNGIKCVFTWLGDQAYSTVTSPLCVKSHEHIKKSKRLKTTEKTDQINSKYECVAMATGKKFIYPAKKVQF